MNKLQSLFKFLPSLAVLLAFAACSTDDSTIIPQTNTPSLVKFNTATLDMPEQAGSTEVVLTFDKSATKNGFVTITINANDIASLTTSPAHTNNKLVVPIISGQASTRFELTLVDNELHEENQLIEFTIADVSEGFTIGKEKKLTLTVLDNDSPTLAGFATEQSTLWENGVENFSVPIEFSTVTPGEGQLEISLGSAESLYGVYFTTEPAAINGKIEVAVTQGLSSAAITFKPLNNTMFNGHKEIHLTLSKTTGVLLKGELLTHTLILTDDELAGKAKGYQVGSLIGWSIRRSYEYNEQGLLSKINWEQNTPGQLTGSYTYSYNTLGQVIEMTESSITKTVYTWENGKITKSEKFKEGVLVAYSTYGYDDAGNVGETAVFYKQESGELKMGLLFVYLYFTNGNIHKQMAYAPVDGPEEYSLLSTKTYDHYLDNLNPFTMVEILPNVITQINLPGSYREEANGFDFLFQLSYEFDETGKPTKRTASSSTGSETAYYEYY